MTTRFLFFTCTAFASLASPAQDEPPTGTPEMYKKGRFFLAASATVKNEDFEVKDITRINLEPMVGYFFIDKLAAGLGGVIGVNNFEYLDTYSYADASKYKYSERNWGALGPFVRGYAGGPKIAAFGQIGAYFGGINETSENNYSSPTVVTYETRDGAFQLYDFGAGVAWYYKQTVGLELAAHYYLAYAQTNRDVHTSTGVVTDYPRERNSADGGGGSVGLVYHFGLAKGAKKPAP